MNINFNPCWITVGRVPIAFIFTTIIVFFFFVLFCFVVVVVVVLFCLGGGGGGLAVFLLGIFPSFFFFFPHTTPAFCQYFHNPSFLPVFSQPQLFASIFTTTAFCQYFHNQSVNPSVKTNKILCSANHQESSRLYAEVSPGWELYAGRMKLRQSLWPQTVYDERR